MEKEIIKVNSNDRNWCNISVQQNGYILEFWNIKFVARNLKELNEIINKNLVKKD